MDSRIPKPSVKPAYNTAGNSRPGPSHVAPLPAFAGQNRVLRRRSKSVTDLRKMTKQSEKGSTALSTLRAKPAQKRPLATNNADNVKQPKVMKMKIPDWDYKSRYQEEHRKNTLIQEELKTARSTLIDCHQIKDQRDNLLKENVQYKKELDNLKNQLTVTSNECKVLENECQSVKSKHDELKEAHRSLQNEVQRVTGQLRDSLSQLDITRECQRNTASELENLKRRFRDLEAFSQLQRRELEEHEALRRHLHNALQDIKGTIRVFCRVRPAINEAERQKPQCCILFNDENSIEIQVKGRDSISTVSGRPTETKHEFSFDKVFPPEASQCEIFEELSQLVQSALDGFHVCVFAYGQTGSGKTYTMQGTSDNHGMIPLTIDLVFEKIEKLKLSGWTYTVTASFIEIYNENLKDLLEPSSTKKYELCYNEGRGVTVTNMQATAISSASELKSYMHEALKNRAVAATDFNEESSRSHAVTKICLEGINNTRNICYVGSINLVDLAGSESAKTSAKERLMETKNINRSLSCLGNVMMALHNKDAHVPYRDSKLTYLLQSCLGGNSKSLMFVNISPFEECIGESINSLRFAVKVKDIKTSAKRNKTYTGHNGK